MPIDPYEPELAKRRTTLNIADRQLQEMMARFNNAQKDDSQERLKDVSVALKDYQDAAKGISEWMQQQPD